MTEKFYCTLLEYISPKEKQTLCSILQKRKVQVNGYGMLKNAPVPLLAKMIAKNEEKFIKILKESYSPEYTDQHQAIDMLSPSTAVTCLTYLLEEQCADEELLLSLMTKQQSHNQAEAVVQPTSARTQKKYEEFRQKYLTANREIEQMKSKIEELERAKTQLHAQIEHQNSTILCLQKELTDEKVLHEEDTLSLRRKIEYLEFTLSNTQIDNKSQVNEVIVLSQESCPVPGVTTLAIDDVYKLSEIIDDYRELLFVANDLPFHVRRLVNKLTGAQGKLHTFSTNAELIEYLERGRK